MFFARCPSSRLQNSFINLADTHCDRVTKPVRSFLHVAYGDAIRIHSVHSEFPNTFPLSNMLRCDDAMMRAMDFAIPDNPSLRVQQSQRASVNAALADATSGIHPHCSRPAHGAVSVNSTEFR